MKATGKLINLKGQITNMDVAIELPKGIRVIGKCKECDWFDETKNLDCACFADGTAMSTAQDVNMKGCGYLKPKK